MSKNSGTAPLVVVSGPPGAGKTTVARLLAATSEPSAHIEGDAFWSFIARGRTEPWREQSAGQNHVVVTALTESAATFAAGGYFTVVDFVLGSWFLDVIRSVGARHGVATHWVVLRPDLDVAIQRSRSRLEGLTDEEVIAHLHDQFALPPQLEPHVVDNSSQTPDVTAAAIVRGLPAGRFRI